MSQPLVKTYPTFNYDACTLGLDGRCTRVSHVARHAREAELVDGPVIRASVFRYPDPKSRTHRDKPFYSLIVYYRDSSGTQIKLSGRNEWGVCLAIALAEVQHLRDGIEEVSAGIVGVPASYGLRHPILAYRVEDRWLRQVMGFHTEQEALAWARKT